MVVDGCLGLIELHRDLAFSVHMQREYIRSGIMPARVKLPARGARGFTYETVLADYTSGFDQNLAVHNRLLEHLVGA